jgi:hypothetical protein
MHKWLELFYYKSDLSAAIFPVSALAFFLIKCLRSASIQFNLPLPGLLTIFGWNKTAGRRWRPSVPGTTFGVSQSQTH